MKYLNSIRNRRIIASVFFAILILVGLFAPFPQTVKGPFIIEPTAVWTIRQAGAGEITTEWNRDDLGISTPRLMFNFDRPDLIELRVNNHLKDGGMVDRGDTVAVIISRKATTEIGIVEAQLLEARAEESALRAGGREEDLAVARKDYEQANAELETFRLEHARVKSLYEQGIAALSLWQQTEGRLQVLQTGLELARAKINALEAGARPEDIEIANAQVNQREKELIAALETLGVLEPIVSPINGTVQIGGIDDIILSIERTDTVSALVAIPEAAIGHIEYGDNIKLKLNSEKKYNLSTTIHGTDYLNGEVSGAFLTAYLDNSDGKLRSGMRGTARVDRGKHTILDSIRMLIIQPNNI